MRWTSSSPNRTVCSEGAPIRSIACSGCPPSSGRVAVRRSLRRRPCRPRRRRSSPLRQERQRLLLRSLDAALDVAPQGKAARLRVSHLGLVAHLQPRCVGSAAGLGRPRTPAAKVEVSQDAGDVAPGRVRSGALGQRFRRLPSKSTSFQPSEVREGLAQVQVAVDALRVVRGVADAGENRFQGRTCGRPARVRLPQQPRVVVGIAAAVAAGSEGCVPNSCEARSCTSLTAMPRR